MDINKFDEAERLQSLAINKGIIKATPNQLQHLTSL